MGTTEPITVEPASPKTDPPKTEPVDEEPVPQRRSVWDQHFGLFLTIIILLALCIIVTVICCICLRCRRREDSEKVRRVQSIEYPQICAALYRDSSLKRSGMARVNEESHSFACPPTRLSTSGMNHTCLYSRAAPATQHHRTLAGTHFPSR